MFTDAETDAQQPLEADHRHGLHGVARHVACVDLRGAPLAFWLFMLVRLHLRQALRRCSRCIRSMEACC